MISHYKFNYEISEPWTLTTLLTSCLKKSDKCESHAHYECRKKQLEKNMYIDDWIAGQNLTIKLKVLQLG